MKNVNPVFAQNYANYLQQLSSTESVRWESVLAVRTDASSKLAEILFLDKRYTVSPAGVVDEHGGRPDYGICVILLKYLLMCPLQMPTETSWVHAREFKDTVQAQNTGMSDYATQYISELFSGNIELLKRFTGELGGKTVTHEYPYDLAAILYALPRVPVLLLFNDRDENFPAATSILYEDRAHLFLDAECRVMVDWYICERLRGLQRQHVY